MINERLRNLLAYAVIVAITETWGAFPNPAFKSVSRIICI